MLKINNLSKKYSDNDFFSLKNVSMEVQKGEIVGLIGKNGAGKSTLMRMIAKSLKPTSGMITYKGKDINSEDNLLQDFGIMIDPVFYPEMSVVGNLQFYLKLHGKKELFSNIEPTLKLLGLWDVRKRKPKGFSFGMKQRTALAIAMVAEPDFLILDEPFVGLDPIGVQNLIDILKKWSAERQISMLISSHQLSELEALCERYVYIEDGRLSDEFMAQGTSGVLVHLNSRVDFQALSTYLNEYVQLNDHALEISTKAGPKELNAILAYLSSRNLINHLSIRETRLKEVFSQGA